MDTAGRAGEESVAVVEDAAVGGHLPVAPAAGGGGHADDRRVEALATRRAVEAGGPVVEDAAVRRHRPVTLRWDVGLDEAEPVARRVGVVAGGLAGTAGGATHAVEDGAGAGACRGTGGWHDGRGAPDPAGRGVRERDVEARVGAVPVVAHGGTILAREAGDRREVAGAAGTRGRVGRLRAFGRRHRAPVHRIDQRLTAVALVVV